MRNIDRIKELESKRKEIYDILANADETVYRMLCEHCKRRSYCLDKNEGKLMRDHNACVWGLEEWLNAEETP